MRAVLPFEPTGRRPMRAYASSRRPNRSWTNQSHAEAQCVVVSDVHQCPRCELKFLNRTELEFHWAEDHPPVEVDVDQEERPDDAGT